jgi:hypothetical protein
MAALAEGDKDVVIFYGSRGKDQRKLSGEWDPRMEGGETGALLRSQRAVLACSMLAMLGK